MLQTQDPIGRYTRFTYDNAGRKLKTINNYVDGTAGGGTNGDEDQITEATYTSGVQTAFTAYVPGGSNQVTTYTYGVPKGTSPGDSKLASGRLLYKVTYPDSASGSDLVTFAYNAQGQLIWKKDQAGNVIETDYDTAGRKTAERATTIISGFDTQVQAIRSAYDSLGRISTVTQYDDPTSTSSGDVTDQVGFTYDNWGNPVTFEQDVNSVIAANGDQWLVTSAWSKATGGSRTLRRTQEVIQRWKNSGGWSLVDTRDIRYSYGSGSSIDDNASRVATVQEQVGGSPVDLATYRYLGSGRVVGITYPEPSEDTVTAEIGYTLGHNALSRSPKLTGGSGNRIGYAGYAWEPVSSKYAVRHRVFDPLRGRWSRRDPVGYVDSPTLYAYVNDRAMTALDPMGLLIASKPISPEGTGKYFVHEGNQVTCAPYVEMGGDQVAANNPGCGMGGGGWSTVPPQNGGCPNGTWSGGAADWSLDAGVGTSAGCKCTFKWCQTWTCSTGGTQVTCDETNSACEVTVPNIDKHDCTIQCGSVKTGNKQGDLDPGCSDVTHDPPKAPK